MAASLATRGKVLSIYRQIFRIAKKWENTEEQDFIREEARRLFRRNMGILHPEKIAIKIEEAEQRIALALHYKNPKPRSMLSANQTPDMVAYFRTTYMDSYYDDEQELTLKPDEVFTGKPLPKSLEFSRPILQDEDTIDDSF